MEEYIFCCVNLQLIVNPSDLQFYSLLWLLWCLEGYNMLPLPLVDHIPFLVAWTLIVMKSVSGLSSGGM